jgi:hypothetical protein
VKAKTVTSQIRALRGFLLVLALIGVFAWLLGGALDQAAAGSAHSRSVATIRLVFGARAPAALVVARCESRLNPRAVSPTSDYGLFQANYWAHHWRGESRAEFAARHFNITYHVRWAYRLSRGGTYWVPWARVCRP